MTKRNQFDHLVSLFERGRDLTPEARASFLDDECGDDVELRGRVEGLFARNDDGGFLDDPIQFGVADEPMPERIGQFEILGHLGQGGMGVVYRAVQQHPKRQVALKVMRAGLFTKDVARRFEFETSVLARLQHGGIAQIYEVGTWEAPSGARPFFAMELVDGISLDAFVAHAAPSIDGRLRLFLDVCDAVHHAHQKGVIHRDLKPANILVSEDGSTKVLDFGIARATDTDVQATLHTTPGQLVGTLAYMSPEQISLANDQLDTRSDVYALGVILYELLAGRLPYELGDKPLTQVVRIISESTPDSLTSVDRRFKGDLATIVAKTLEKEPNRRYAAVSDLAADILRFLNDEPIAARPATTVYQLSKFALRNKGLVAGCCVGFVALLVGVVVSVSFAVQRTRALGEANRQRDIAQAVNEFLERDLLANANPSNEPDRSLTLRQVLDRASKKIAERFADRPSVEAAIRTTLSNTYKGLGEYAEACAHAKAALECLQSISSEPSYEMLLTMNRVASLEKAQGHIAEAEKVFREALRLAEERFGPEHETSMSISNNLALLLERRQAYDEAALLLEPLLERRMRLLGEEHHHTMITMNNLALLYLSMERFEDAERLHLRELELSTRVMGPEHPGTLISIANVAVLYAALENHEKAVSLMRGVVDVQTRVLGMDHPDTLESKGGLANFLTKLGDLDGAESVILPPVATSIEKLGREHPKTLVLHDRLASLYLAMNRLDEAEAIARENHEIRRRVMGDEDARTGVTLDILAQICLAQGKHDDAETHGLRSYEIFKKAFGEKHSKTRKSAEQMAAIYEQLGRQPEAETWRSRAAK